MDQPAVLRMGEFSRQVGEPPELLRAWETRYGLLTPERTAGGLRLYSERDARRVRAMRRHINRGISAAEAARLAILDEQPPLPPPDTLAEITTALDGATDMLDAVAFTAALDGAFRELELSRALEVTVAFLAHIGARWAAGEITICQEHFATNVIRGRLWTLTRGWERGVGPLALLACPPGEQHDLGLLCFGLALRSRGWRIGYFGADTPLDDLAGVADRLGPALIVLAATDRERLDDARDELSELTRRTRVALGGPGATATLAREVGAEHLSGGLLDEARELTLEAIPRVGITAGDG